MGYKTSGAASGAARGAAIGTTIMPGYGTAIGAIIGGLGGFFSGKSKEKNAKKARSFAEEQALKKQREEITRRQRYVDIMNNLLAGTKQGPRDYSKYLTVEKEDLAPEQTSSAIGDAAEGLMEGASMYSQARAGGSMYAPRGFGMSSAPAAPQYSYTRDYQPQRQTDFSGFINDPLGKNRGGYG